MADIAVYQLLRGAGFRECGPGECQSCKVHFAAGYERRAAYRARKFVKRCGSCALVEATAHRADSLARYYERYGMAEKETI
jgi:hypothetical protein